MGLMKEYKMKLQNLCLDAIDKGAEDDEAVYVTVKDLIPTTLKDVSCVLDDIMNNMGYEDR